jgi:hypothetical protein
MLKTCLQRREGQHLPHHHPTNACSVPSECQLTTHVCAPTPQNSAENTLVDQHATLWDRAAPAGLVHLAQVLKTQLQMLTALAQYRQLRSSENTLAGLPAMQLDTAAMFKGFHQEKLIY